MPSIVLFGRSGQIGWELQRTLAPLGRVVALGREDTDLMQAEEIRAALREVQPQLIVNAAAYTAVDQAESEPAAAMAVNGDAVAVMAAEAKRLDAIFVHFSTDYVFDGRSTRPLTETDPVAPLNAYGRSKLAGEAAIRASGLIAYLILRTSWVYAARGRNILTTMQRLARAGDDIRVVNDQLGAPTWARLVAEVTAQVLVASRGGGDWAPLRDLGGTYHLAAAGECSWYDFVRAILAASPRPDGSVAHVAPISSRDYPSKAPRPAYSVLDTALLRSVFAVSLPHWRQGLDLCLDLPPRASMLSSRPTRLAPALSRPA